MKHPDTRTYNFRARLREATARALRSRERVNQFPTFELYGLTYHSCNDLTNGVTVAVEDAVQEWPK